MTAAINKIRIDKSRFREDFQALDIGVVSAIVGIRSFRMVFKGRADHAGTTPMNRRRDPALGAAAFTLSARKLVMDRFPDCVITVGDMQFDPGAFNVVPRSVTVCIEFRADDIDTLDAMETAVVEEAEARASCHGLGVTVEPLERVLPVPTDKNMQQAIFESLGRLELKGRSMASGAGHDAQALACICPVGMIFVPSEGGASHSPREFTQWQDCINGANVLLQTTMEIACTE